MFNKIKKKVAVAAAALMLQSMVVNANAIDIEKINGDSRVGNSFESASYVDSDKVALVSVDSFADGLSVGNVLYATGARLLLVDADTDISSAIRPTDTVYIIGGENTVNGKPVNQAKQISKNVIRLSGKNRYETNKATMNFADKYMNKKHKNFFAVDGRSYPDALSSYSWLKSKGSLLMLVDGSKPFANTQDGRTMDCIIGGENSVKYNATNRMRIAGKNRYATSLKISQQLNKTDVILVTGKDFAGAFAAMNLVTSNPNSSILLVDGKLKPEQKSFLINRGTMFILGSSLNKTIGEEMGLSNPSNPNSRPSKPNSRPEIDTSQPSKPNSRPEDLLPELKPDIQPKPTPNNRPTSPTEPLTNGESELIGLINDHRVKKGLKPLSVSKSLTRVARVHIKDLTTSFPTKNYPVDERGQKGNSQSWSSNGNWTPVAYTSDHKYAAKMWAKPSEIAGYNKQGFEITTSNDIAQSSFAGLVDFQGTNDLLLSQGIWGEVSEIGVAINSGYTSIWFAKNTNTNPDPNGYFK